MAYTKLIVIHSRLDRCLDYTQDEEKTSLETVLDYAMNRDKTEQDCFETALNCSQETAYADMMDTKRRWGKVSRKRKGYHVIQSFAPGEVTPEQAHAIGVELAQRLLADRYEVVVSTHLNKAHLHSHIVFNSVSFVDGAMYRDRIKDLLGGAGEGIRGTSDAICLEYGLSIIEPSEPSVSRAEWEAQQSGKPSFRSTVRVDIDTAIAGAYTMRSFWSELARMGYQIKRYPQVTHAAVKPPGGQRFLRLDKLGDGYSEAEILTRLTAGRIGAAPPISDHTPILPQRYVSRGRRYRVRGKLPQAGRPKGFRLLYLKYLYLLRTPSRRKAAIVVPREEVIRFDRYSAQFLYKCWKRFRKYAAAMTAATQNIEECLRSETARLMLANSEFLILLNQAATDRAELAKLLHISETQMSHVTNVEAGHGLMRIGSSIIPFINEFPRDSELYRLMSTTPGDK